MDSFNFNIKVKKANAIKKRRKLQKLAGLLRLLEICLVLVLLSGFSIQLPLAVKNLSLNLLSPRFVFVVGNVIVITLFIKSGQFSGQDRDGESLRNDLYGEFVEKSEKIHHPVIEDGGKQGNSVFQHVVAEDTNACGTPGERRYERSRSENFGQPRHRKAGRELRRSTTGSCKEMVAAAVDGWKKGPVHEDRMSSEEFKITVEAFIERQKRFRKDEENSIF